MIADCGRLRVVKHAPAGKNCGLVEWIGVSVAKSSERATEGTEDSEE